METYRTQRLFSKVSKEDKEKLRKASKIENLSYIPSLVGGMAGVVGLNKGSNPWNKTTKAGLASMALGTAGIAYGDSIQRKIYNRYHPKKQIKSTDPGIYGGTLDADNYTKNQWVRKNKK